MAHLPVGILGIGTYLPKEVRNNDFWGDSFTATFEERKRGDITIPELTDPVASDIAKEVIGKYESDPFRGSVERRVLDADLSPSWMEIEAARVAIDRANIKPSDIDLVITASMVPDVLGSNNAALVHHGLGLRRDVASVAIDNHCSSLLPSLNFAAQLVAGGSVKCALLVQSVAFSRILDYQKPLSVNFGDGASAAIVGRVDACRGVLGWSSFTDGSYHRAAAIAPKLGGEWYQGTSRSVVAALDFEKGRTLGLKLGLLSKQAVEAALVEADLSKQDVNFFASHQPVSWFVELCLRTSGLTNANTCDTFSRYASVGPANILLSLDEGVRQGKVKPDDVVLMYACGSGMTWSATVLRWGC